MSAPLLSKLFLSALTLAALPACDAPPVADESTELRAVTITDRWGRQDPWHAPDVNSCNDYWNDRCANESPQGCGMLQSRYSCSEGYRGGVIIIDNFATPIMGLDGGWRVHGPGEDGFSKLADSPLAACALLNASKHKSACKSLAAAAALAPELLALAPEGGLAPVLPVGEVDEGLPLFADDILLATLDPLDWKVPALAFEARAALGESIVIVDDIMYMVAPDGTVAVSNKDILLIRDVRGAMDKVEVSVDVDVK